MRAHDNIVFVKETENTRTTRMMDLKYIYTITFMTKKIRAVKYPRIRHVLH